jgi:7,8-dihydropterin-6-yl-methyl-4-(beta-D-ribofuranosyl)aminobenzene 5'-phosphate synthase
VALQLQPVDQVHVRVLIDNVTDSLSSNPAIAESEWSALRNAGMDELSGEGACCAKHGLSLVIEAEIEGRRQTVLFDAGPEAYALQRNAFRLGIDMGAIGAVVLSHGHWDHAGGLPMAIALIRQRNQERDVPVYVHPHMFRQRGARQPDGSVLPHKPIADVDELTEVGGSVLSSAAAMLLGEAMFYLSGEIPRHTDYETGYAPHVRRTSDGTGWEPDPLIMDERFLAVHVRGKGIVTFTACSHAGVINVLSHARTCFEGAPLYAVVGGLHLAGASESRIPSTVRDLRAFGLSHIVPAHCTGWRAVSALAAEFGDAVVPGAVGKGFRF